MTQAQVRGIFHDLHYELITEKEARDQILKLMGGIKVYTQDHLLLVAGYAVAQGMDDNLSHEQRKAACVDFIEMLGKEPNNPDAVDEMLEKMLGTRKDLHAEQEWKYMRMIYENAKKRKDEE